MRTSRKSGEILRRFAILAAVLALVPQRAAIAGVNNHYARWKLGQPFGYRDLKILPGRWKVRGLSFHAGMDFTVATALHRIAIHAKAGGFDQFYTVSMKATCSNLFSSAPPAGCQGTALDEEVDIVAVGYRAGQPSPACEETGRWNANCKEFQVAELLMGLRSSLGLSVDQDEEEAAQIEHISDSGLR